MDRQFLALDDVLFVHEDRVQKYGGSSGLRDLGVLESAAAMPQATFGGAYLHSTIYEMAAAYLLHVNHPFVDGNKRGGSGVCARLSPAERDSDRRRRG